VARFVNRGGAMTASPRKPRLFRPIPNATSDINVTPLVDVVLVLLIIFMVVTPLVEKDISVRTPATELAPLEVPPDDIVVYVDGGGHFRLNASPLAEGDLEATLKRLLAPRAEADRTVFVVAHDACPYGTFVHVLDVARGAGAQVLGVPTDPADPQLFL
jgi:biopolymer transport protein TolR